MVWEQSDPDGSVRINALILALDSGRVSCRGDGCEETSGGRGCSGGLCSFAKTHYGLSCIIWYYAISLKRKVERI